MPSCDLFSLGDGSGLIGCGSFGSAFGLVSTTSSSSSVLMFPDIPPILRFFGAADLAIAAFDFSRGAACVIGLSDGPPLGCIPLAFMRRSYRFALYGLALRCIACMLRLTRLPCSLCHIPSQLRRSQSAAVSFENGDDG